jgi:hypothetical protein
MVERETKKRPGPLNGDAIDGGKVLSMHARQDVDKGVARSDAAAAQRIPAVRSISWVTNTTPRLVT